jgi:hypothetical protein
MRRLYAGTLAAGLMLAATGVQARQMSDAQVRQQIIREAIASYQGRCPCPYSKVGRPPHVRTCGSRSAYNQPGANIQCYPRDVTPDGVDAWRSEHGR